MAENDAKSAPVKSRKERRMQWWGEHQANQQNEEDNSAESTDKTVKPPVEAESADTTETKGKKSGKKAKFYVLFVGQIPYSATTEDVTKHFSTAGELKSVRLATHKDTGKSRGFGYIEFKNNKSYMRGLAMHLSMLHGRPINVEITSPGRGTSLIRKENLKRKNVEMARFRGIIEGDAAGGAMCIPASKPHPGGNKKQKFNKGRR
ncbi:nucleolin 1 [Strongylocentrotus purpuratus]|uniref:RRM domain-containing protein n=1 Tax=Strongylocentrotus purpuratus TaxID=7668 RepID=A0A7M7MXL1_STRPU|nr:nucleolin 1 [Strongylocentrotus purpuratus]